MISVSLIDYGCGNIFSIARALERFNVSVTLTDDPDQLLKADRVILPGVGAFATAMKKLREKSLDEAIASFVKSGKPFLGICLGMQLLLRVGYEFEVTQGLGFIDGVVESIKPVEPHFKVPHVGWNHLKSPSYGGGDRWKKSILKDFPEGKDVYFVHSFIAKIKDNADCLALTEYGGCEFASAVQKGNIVGCQFHPEKSGKHGLKILENFVYLGENSNT
jgi:imidazole glycerol-phosphate synthase subunit HisH